jgi:hypothetical protein
MATFRQIEINSTLFKRDQVVEQNMVGNKRFRV